MTPNILISLIASAFGLSADDLTGPSRMRHIVLARQAACWVLRQASPLSQTEIGRLLGGRDHTTIGYSIAQIERRIASDPLLRAQLHSLLPQEPFALARRRPRDAGGAWWISQSRDTFFVRTA